MTRPRWFGTSVAVPVALAAVLLSACQSSVNAVKEEKPVVPEYLEIAVPAGTVLAVELETPLASNTARVEDRVRARTRDAVVVGGREVIPAGSEITGTVVAARPSGKVKGRARLTFRFTRIDVQGVTYDIGTKPVSYEARGTKTADATKIGAGAAAGALIGAIAGGGKGAAVGAAVGGGAGTAVVLMTPGKEVSLPSGTPVSIRVQEGFAVRVKRT